MTQVALPANGHSEAARFEWSLAAASWSGLSSGHAKPLFSDASAHSVNRIGDIVPEIEVEPTPRGIREGRDEVLERALAYVNGLDLDSKRR
ncbi:MAG TPA: hypothetical protein VJW76_09235 [Verrucomicrobiae bacterium]|nr:hypothetical protein [Verrucomicrobiae bacterium]